jgi:hypothetical protein
MLDLVNAERRAAGLKPVKADPELVQVARAHSRDMLARGYFSHVSPDGKDLGDRLQQAPAGLPLGRREPGAGADAVQRAQGLMHSPGPPRQHPAAAVRPARHRHPRCGVARPDGHAELPELT